MTCTNCEQLINEELGIITMHLKIPEAHAIYHFCSSLCLAPWIEKINKIATERNFGNIMRSLMESGP